MQTRHGTNASIVQRTPCALLKSLQNASTAALAPTPRRNQIQPGDVKGTRLTAFLSSGSAVPDGELPFAGIQKDVILSADEEYKLEQQKIAHMMLPFITGRPRMPPPNSQLFAAAARHRNMKLPAPPAPL